MFRARNGVWLVVTLLAAAVTWPASAAEQPPTPVEQPKAAPTAAQKPADDKAASEEPAAEKADPFVVPEGTPKELVAYITKLITAPPPHDRDRLKKLRKAILQAAEKILAAKPSDEEMEFAVQAKMNMLEKPEQLTDFIAELQQERARKVRPGGPRIHVADRPAQGDDGEACGSEATDRGGGQVPRRGAAAAGRSHPGVRDRACWPRLAETRS